jgi:hypothetical protein
MATIQISWGSIMVQASLLETASAQALLDCLPCESHANTWGEEAYFKIPADVELDADARQVVDPGTLCIWVEGQSLALPYGPTPLSQGNECRLISKVNVIGKLLEDPRILASIHDGDLVRVEQLRESP